jgi:NADH dehydrogenase FAD-containing subunit
LANRATFSAENYGGLMSAAELRVALPAVAANGRRVVIVGGGATGIEAEN